MRAIIVVQMILWTTCLGAAEYHLAPGGDDGDDGSASAPWATFEQAAKKAGAGDVVVIHDGIYRPGSKVVQWKGGAPGNPVVFSGNLRLSQIAGRPPIPSPSGPRSPVA